MDEGIKQSGFIYAGGWSAHLSGLAQWSVTTVCPVFSLNSISNPFPGWGTPQLVCMCVGGPEISSWAKPEALYALYARETWVREAKCQPPAWTRVRARVPLVWYLERAQMSLWGPAGSKPNQMVSRVYVLGCSLMSHKQSGIRICAVDGPRPTELGQDWYLGEKKKKVIFKALIWESSPPALCVITWGVSERCTSKVQPQCRAVSVIST